MVTELQIDTVYERKVQQNTQQTFVLSTYMIPGRSPIVGKAQEKVNSATSTDQDAGRLQVQFGVQVALAVPGMFQ